MNKRTFTDAGYGSNSTGIIAFSIAPVFQETPQMRFNKI